MILLLAAFLAHSGPPRGETTSIAQTSCGLPSPSGASVCGQKFELLSSRLE